MDYSYKGTHGTTCSASEKIEVNGFDKGAGLRGQGIYFWLYKFEALLDEVTELARSWHQDEKRRGSYAGHANTDCAVIYVNLDVVEKDVFDFESKRQLFMVFSKAVQERLNEGNIKSAEKKQLLSGLYDKFFHAWESKSQKTFNAVVVKVQKPKSCKSFFDPDIATQPECILVRNENIINIENITKIKQ